MPMISLHVPAIPNGMGMNEQTVCWFRLLKTHYFKSLCFLITTDDGRSKDPEVSYILSHAV